MKPKQSQASTEIDEVNPAIDAEDGEGTDESNAHPDNSTTEDNAGDEDGSQENSGSDHREDGDGSESDEGEEGEGTESGQESELVLQLRAANDRIARLEKDQEDSKKNQTESKPQIKRSEEEYTQIENTHGMARNQVDYLDSQLVGLARSFRGFVEDKFGELTIGGTVDGILGRKEYADVKRFKSDVLNSLKSLPRELREKEEHIVTAILAARGKNHTAAIRKAIGSKESNKRIIGKARIVGMNGKKSKNSSIQLTDSDRKMLKQTGISESDFMELSA